MRFKKSDFFGLKKTHLERVAFFWYLDCKVVSMKKSLLVFALVIPFYLSSCSFVLDVLSASLEYSVGKPDLYFDWDSVYGGVRVSGSLTNDSEQVINETSIKVYFENENGDSDYDWIEIDERIETGSCVRFCETVYTNLDNVTDVRCEVSSYD